MYPSLTTPCPTCPSLFDRGNARSSSCSKMPLSSRGRRKRGERVNRLVGPRCKKEGQKCQRNDTLAVKQPWLDGNGSEGHFYKGTWQRRGIFEQALELKVYLIRWFELGTEMQMAQKGLGYLVVYLLLLSLLARYKLSCYQTTRYLQFQHLQTLPYWKLLVISFFSSLGSTLLLIEKSYNWSPILVGDTSPTYL